MAASTDHKQQKGLWMRILSWGIVLAAAAFTIYVYFHDPFKGGVTFCTFHAMTGLDCPGCGMTRAAYLLMHGHPIESLKMNPFLPVVFVAAYMGLAELSPYLIGKQLPQLSIPNWMLITLLILLIIFSIARNIPSFL